MHMYRYNWYGYGTQFSHKMDQAAWSANKPDFLYFLIWPILAHGFMVTKWLLYLPALYLHSKHKEKRGQTPNTMCQLRMSLLPRKQQISNKLCHTDFHLHFICQDQVMQLPMGSWKRTWAVEFLGLHALLSQIKLEFPIKRKEGTDIMQATRVHVLTLSTESVYGKAAINANYCLGLLQATKCFCPEWVMCVSLSFTYDTLVHPTSCSLLLNTLEERYRFTY